MGDSIRAMLIVTGININKLSTTATPAEKTFSKIKKKEIEKVLGIDFVE